MRFKDRNQAGRLLSQRLATYRGRNPLVLGIPRGGVAVGRRMADALEGELDVVLVHKLTAPTSPEFAIGSITEDGQVELGPYAAEPYASCGALRQEIRDQADLIRRRRSLYTPVKPPVDPAGRIVIVVDDGLATGWTMMAALRALRARKPARLVAAVPVAAPKSLERVGLLADETVFLLAPEEFVAVGQFYENFDAVTDEEVVGLLGAAGKARRGPADSGFENGEKSGIGVCS